MNKLWLILVVFCAIFGIFTGRGQFVMESMLASGSGAVALAISLAGAYMLWCGLLAIMEKSGLVASLSRALRPVFRLFPGIYPDSEAGRAIATNLAANILGLGNAATPAGIEAMRQMRRLSPDKDEPSEAMCMFLAINASSIQLIPTTVISMRAAAGCANPADIALPALFATACSTLFAVVAMRFLFAVNRRKGNVKHDSTCHSTAASRGGSGTRRVAWRRGI